MSIYGRAAIEREHRRVRHRGPEQPVVAAYVVRERGRNARSKGNESALAEFGASDHQQLSFEIDVVVLQTADFTDSETEPVQERENNAVGGATMSCIPIVTNLRRCIQKALCRGLIEDERQPATG